MQKTWRELEIAPDQTAKVFYARLFAIAPDSAALFAAADMRAQREKLMLTLRHIVSNLSDQQMFSHELQELGRRHQAYGVRPEHYTVVGEALLYTLEAALGPAFSPPVRAAWSAAYQLIAEYMQAPTAIH